MIQPLPVIESVPRHEAAEYLVARLRRQISGRSGEGYSSPPPAGGSQEDLDQAFAHLFRQAPGGGPMVWKGLDGSGPLGLERSILVASRILESRIP